MFKKKLITAAISAITLIGLNGCMGLPVVAPIFLPPEPILPRIAENEFSCMNQNAYTLLVERAVKSEAHIDTLRAIIEAHNKEANE